MLGRKTHEPGRMFTSGLGKGIAARLKAAFLFSVVVAWPYLIPPGDIYRE